METLAKVVPDRIERLDPGRTTLVCNAVPFKDVWLPMDEDLFVTVDLLEDYIAQNFPQIETPLTQVFADGLYTREVFIPEGTLITGQIYNEQHMAVLLSGEILVWTEGDGVRHLTAPATLVSQPGTRRIGRALTDVRWMTIHQNYGNVTDQSEIEKRIYRTRDRRLLSDGDAERVQAFLEAEMGVELIPAYVEVA